MSPAELVYGLQELIKEFPGGTLIWHRGTGRRGVVVGWTLDCDGTSLVKTDYDSTGGYDYACSLSKKPVPDGGDGEEWKEGAGKS